MTPQNLNKLKQYHSMLKNLHRDLQQSIHWDMHEGLGSFSARTYSAIHQALRSYLQDDMLDLLALEVNENADEKQKLWIVKVATGQLLAYIEGELNSYIDEDQRSRERKGKRKSHDLEFLQRVRSDDLEAED